MRPGASDLDQPTFKAALAIRPGYEYAPIEAPELLEVGQTLA